MLRLVLTALIALAICFAACTTTVDPDAVSTVEPPDGNYTHAATGVKFPKAVGSFTRGDIDQYDDEGNDVSVGYRNEELLVTATVFIYPATVHTDAGSQPDQQHFAAVKEQIREAQPMATVIVEDERVVLADAVGRWASFRFEAMFAGAQRMLHSDAFLFGYGDWYVKYRFTYPDDGGSKAASSIEEFMALVEHP